MSGMNAPTADRPLCLQCLKPLAFAVVYGSWWRAECRTEGCVDKGYVRPSNAVAEGALA